MASTSNHGSLKRLAELLGEEQDPFVLQSYLLERGCRLNSLEVERDTKYNLTKLLKRPSPKSSVQFSKLAASLYKRFISNHVLRLKHSKRKHGSDSRMKNCAEQDEANELGRLSNDSSITGGNNLSESEMDTESVASPSKDANCEIAQGGAVTQWRPVEDNKQHSPVSVLDAIDFVQTIPVYHGYGNETVREEEKPSASKPRIQKKVSDDSILSASMWELLISSQRNKTKQSRPELSLPQLINSKKSLQQTRQLLFDCVREVVENQNKKQRKNTSNKQKGLMTGPEEMGNIICNKLKTWGEMRLSNEETDLKQVLRMDLVSSFEEEEEEWGDFEVYKKAIAFEIGDEILSDLIGQF